MNCQEITTRINNIKTMKTDFDELFMQGKFREAKALQTELSKLIQEAIKEAILFITIEGKEFSTFSLEIGGKTAKELEKELLAKNINITSNARDMLYSSDFISSPTKKRINLVRLKVNDLGLSANVTTTAEIYAKAKEVGLEICPAEVAPYLRLIHTDQVLNDWYVIAMKQFDNNIDGQPRVFYNSNNKNKLWLFSHLVSPTNGGWFSGNEFVFQVPTK